MLLPEPPRGTHRRWQTPIRSDTRLQPTAPEAIVRAGCPLEKNLKLCARKGPSATVTTEAT
jgi:hypothetical protein